MFIMCGSESIDDDLCVLHSRVVPAADEIVSVISTSKSSSGSSSSLIGANGTGKHRRSANLCSIVNGLASVMVPLMKHAKCHGSGYRKYSVLEADM